MLGYSKISMIFVEIMRVFRVPGFIQRWFYEMTWRIPQREKCLYLTFDDGPHPSVTLSILDILRKFNVSATFFCVGQNIEKYPEVIEDIISNGHSLGNHTFNHLKGWKTPNATYFENIDQAKALFDNHGGTTLFRPPYGRIRRSQARYLLQQGYKIIMWHILSYDYDSSIDIDYCTQKIIKKSRNGSIVVFHDSLKSENQVLKMLPSYIESMQKKGFTFKLLPQ